MAKWNKKINPTKEGYYLIRYKNKDGKILEKKSYFSFYIRKCKCEVTDYDVLVLWSGSYQEQPIAWKEIG